MRISDLLSICARNLTRRKFRTFLTVMGVVIGTSFIVMMISLGIGIERSNMRMLETWGDLTMVTIHNQGNTETPLNDTAIEAIRAMPQVQAVTPVAELRLDNVNVVLTAGRGGRYEWWGGWGIVGLDPAALPYLGYDMREGDILPVNEDGTRVVRMMFGERAAYNFQDTRRRWPNNMIEVWNVMPGDPLPDPFFNPMEEQTIRITLSSWEQDSRDVEFEVEVVGVMVGSWDFNRPELMDGAVMDVADLQRMIAEFNRANSIRPDRNAVEGFDMARVKAHSIDDVADVEAAIHAMGFPNTQSMEEIRQSMQEAAQQIQMILGFIGGVALFISSLSIMNTMIMSVYERTREIGVMKVLGCHLGNIRSIFLIEAALIGFIGGVVGNALSALASFALNAYVMGNAGGGMMGMGMEPMPVSVIPLWLMSLGLVFATIIGLVSGIIPALRAVKISALEAIRTE
ncbi:MAG: ABC transporter permease [Oscillospiraceae bacterium]|nr:ABC transporter permease [Oscillospiraceae bacterium]